MLELTWSQAFVIAGWMQIAGAVILASVLAVAWFRGEI